MKYTVEFIKEFAEFKKGDQTDKYSSDMVSQLKSSGTVKIVGQASALESKGELRTALKALEAEKQELESKLKETDKNLAEALEKVNEQGASLKVAEDKAASDAEAILELQTANDNISKELSAEKEKHEVAKKTLTNTKRQLTTANKKVAELKKA